ncbi:peptidoglycan-binding protein [uncultured Marinococcus sp.]|uniref:peptidoglycan-binding protein n=1 Tax=uncultured Marinococcus sp. TaxID=487012 RepID=UPI0026094504|nr:peptidoglycan-binding protein [uncultured Marinococcus sp.]
MFKNFIFVLAGVLLAISFVLSTSTPANAASNIVKYGDNSSQAQELKEDLYELGYLDIANPTKYFGKQTERAVEDFQKDHSLTVDGVAGPNTFSKINEIIHSKSSGDSNTNSSVLKDGVTSPAAKAMKEDLYTLGYLDIANPNERFGPQTAAAVKDFQRDHGLVVDGVAGPNTLAKISDELQALSSDEDDSSSDDSADSGSTLLKDGVRSEAAKAVKADLYTLGYLDISEPTTHFGPLTAAAVKDFQRDHGLVVDGVAGPNTLAKISDELQALSSDEDDSSSDDSADSGSTLLKDGVRSEAAKAVKADLYTLGYLNISEPTTHFGPLTAAAVKDFQRDHGLVVDGVAGPNTLAKISDELQALSSDENDSSSDDSADSGSTLLKDGVHSKEAQLLKTDLYTLGYLNISEPTTHFGPLTAAAVKDFQRDHGLMVDGVAGPNTLAKLREVLKNPPSDEDDSSDDSNSNDSDSGLLKDGVDSPAAKAMKEDLYTLGYLDISSPNGKFGPQTEAAVKEFQRDHDLYVDGVAGPKTLAKISEVLSTKGSDDEASDDDASDVGDPGNYGSISIMKVGTTHDGVVQLKLDLEALGFMSVSNPSNQFDSSTAQAVKDFQRSENLAVDGVAGPNTMKALRAALNVDETYPSESAVAGKTIVVDAGHGDHDPGAQGNGLKEKDINLETSKYLASKLRAAGANVVMTRESDKYLSLSQRSSIANNAGADAFISIHTNAGGGHGIETYWYSKYEGAESKELAEEIQSGIIRETSGRSRGVKQGNFHVIRETKVPSVLVEVGFIDNATEASYLKQSSYREKLAEGIYQGTNSYFSKN